MTDLCLSAGLSPSLAQSLHSPIAGLVSVLSHCVKTHFDPGGIQWYFASFLCASCTHEAVDADAMSNMPCQKVYWC